MHFITSFYLKDIIYTEINYSIQMHREATNTFILFDSSEHVTAKESEEFVESCPYYGEALKSYSLPC